jgi:FkbM family methyltransferase
VAHIATSPLPCRLKRRILRDYLVSIELKRDGSGGAPLRIAGHSVSYLDFGSLVFQFHELFVELQYYIRLNTPQPLIVDCGSNIGLSVIFFTTLFPNAHILAFEPDPQAFGCLVRNIEANRLRRVVARRVAVTAEDGEADFFYDPDRPGYALNSTIPGRVRGAATRVPCERLSTIIDRHVDLLKLDIEGAELPVLRDLFEEARMSLIDNCLIEYHHHIHPQEDGFASLLSLLEASGFGYLVDAPRYPGHIPLKYQDLLVYAYRIDGLEPVK